jgi:hypothetical protein
MLSAFQFASSSPTCANVWRSLQLPQPQHHDVWPIAFPGAGGFQERDLQLLVPSMEELQDAGTNAAHQGGSCRQTLRARALRQPQADCGQSCVRQPGSRVQCLEPYQRGLGSPVAELAGACVQDVLDYALGDHAVYAWWRCALQYSASDRRHGPAKYEPLPAPPPEFVVVSKPAPQAAKAN